MSSTAVFRPNKLRDLSAGFVTRIARTTPPRTKRYPQMLGPSREPAAAVGNACPLSDCLYTPASRGAQAAQPRAPAAEAQDLYVPVARKVSAKNGTDGTHPGVCP